MPRRQPLTQTSGAASRTATSRRLLFGCVSVGVVLALAGCSNGPVVVAVDEPVGVAREACLDLDAELPTSLLDQGARTTDPESPFTAAWGAPAITLVCGVPSPRDRPADAQLFEIEGITWFAQPLTAGTRFTSEGRVANVQVDVPQAYRPEADALVELAPAITRTVKLTD